MHAGRAHRGAIALRPAAAASNEIRPPMTDDKRRAARSMHGRERADY